MEIVSRSKDFYSTAGGDQKKLCGQWRVSSGLSALSHEPAKTTDRPEKTKTETKP
jgi:hypothetical protein